MSDRLFVFMQYLLPKQALTWLAGLFANARLGWLTHWVIRWFIKRYQVNMQEAAEPNATAYPTFNAFFTRALKPDARPLSQADLICPVDGAISQFGAIHDGQIFQAKGHDYSCEALLAGNASLAEMFLSGSFATLYLSPRDYHRIHMPCDGTLLSMTYVPGSLFSVNPATAQGVSNLFARNERVVCEFESPTIGRFVMVLVGATIVGSMATVWHGVVNAPRTGRIQRWKSDGEIVLRQGEEMGRFLLGSTVVMLFPSGVSFAPTWHAGKAVQLGENMAAFSADA